ncbi:MAG: HlyD family secretion protein [Muribaculaceae bacterium]
MKKEKDIKAVVFTALLLITTAILVIIIGLNLPEKTETIQGQVETTDYRVSGKVTSRIVEFRVKEGDMVHTGDTLVILYAPEIDAKLAQAQAAVTAAKAMENKAINGARQEQITQAYEMWQKARAAVEVSEKTYARVSNLFEQGVVAEQKLDEAKAQYDAMVATEKAALSQYEMAMNGTRYEDKNAAGAQVVRAIGAVSEVESYIGETVLLAMADGVVTEIFPEVGELVGAGAPIMNITSTDEYYFTFNVREDLLPGIKVGTVSEVYLPAYDINIKVRITKMKNVGNFAAWKATKALDGYDLKTFEVEAVPVDTVNLDGIRNGMSAIIKKKTLVS